MIHELVLRFMIGMLNLSGIMVLAAHPITSMVIHYRRLDRERQSKITATPALVPTRPVPSWVK